MTEQRYYLVRVQGEAATAYLTHTEVAADCGIHPELISRFVSLGLLDPVGRSRSDEWLFDAGAVPLVRKILRLRNQLGVNYAGIGVVLELLTRVEELEARIRELERMVFS